MTFCPMKALSFYFMTRPFSGGKAPSQEGGILAALKAK